MNFIGFTDIHIDKHKKQESRLHDCLKVLNWVFDEAEARNIKDVVFFGDLFQDRHKIDVQVYQLTFDIIAKRTKNIKLWLLLGNHDLWYNDKTDISSVAPFNHLTNVQVIDKPCTLNICGADIDFLPFTHDPLDDLLKLRKSRTLIAHLAVDQAQLNTLHNTRSDVVIEHDGDMVKVGKDLFKFWDQVWLGHYHAYQKLANIEYLGSPLQLNFGEAFQHKYILVYDPVDLSRTLIKNTFSPTHLIIPEKDLDDYELTGNFVRVVTENAVEAKNKVQKLKPESLEIILVKPEDSEHLVNDVKEILQNPDFMIENYVKNVETSLGKQKLLEIGKIICEEIKV